jgi:hypothetical protein
MLDWDKPLSEQPAAVRSALQPIKEEMAQQMIADASKWGNPSPEDYQGYLAQASQIVDKMKGERLYQELANAPAAADRQALFAGKASNPLGPVKAGDIAASARLKDLGIPGIRYLDAGSRTVSDDALRGVTRAQSKVAALTQQYASTPTEALANRLSDAQQELQSAQRGVGDMTRNIVLFDDKLAKIVKRE